MRVCGQVFSPETLERIAATLDEEPHLSRRALSRRVCQWLNWRAPNGRLKEMSCRVALGRLARAGVIALPASTACVPERARRAPRDCEFAELSPLKARLSELGRVELVLVRSRHSRASRQWRALMQRHHYLGAGALCGAQLRYLVHAEHYGVVGALAFSSAAWRVGARDRFIGWNEQARAANLQSVVANSRFLILPQVKVAHLASHVLGLCARGLPEDWFARYGVRPLLLESFVERGRFRGTCYRAANWLHVGSTCGRGRQDRTRTEALPLKDLYVYPLHRQWRERLQAHEREVKAVQPRPLGAPGLDWTREEFGTVELGDARLKARLLTIAQDFYAKPQAQIPQACGSRSKTKAAYRFFAHADTSMDAILQPHHEAACARIAAHPVVLAVQDTTSLNYNTQPAIENLGPIGTRADTWMGLMVHDTMAFSPEGLPLGLIAVECWARDAKAFGKRHQRKELPIEEKESYKWLKSVEAAAHVQARCPQTTVVSVADREADIFELFEFTRKLEHAPRLLIRAEQNRKLDAEEHTLWAHMGAQPIAGYQTLEVPRRGNRAARVARMAISYARVELKAPQRLGRLQPVGMWAVWAREVTAPAQTQALEWMLLTTCPVESFEQATEKIAWYCARWNIEIYHRTLKSGCRIETRQLGAADRIESCLAIDMVVAWRILHLTKLGREHPDVPCTVYFKDMEWKALVTFVTRNAILPPNPPSLREAKRMVAGLGGFLGRRCDGEPGAQVVWLGLQRLDDLTLMYEALTEMLARSPPTVSSSHTYG
jgi:hypothetical protein